MAAALSGAAQRPLWISNRSGAAPSPRLTWKSKARLELGGFTLTGIADRIDLLADGGAAILDYKTGACPARNRCSSSSRRNCRWKPRCWPQDGFGIGKFIAGELIYLSLAGEKQARKPRDIEDPVTLGGRSGRATAAPHRLVRPEATRPIGRGCSRTAPISPATTTIWRGCANGRRPAGARSHEARSDSMIASDPEISAWVAANAGAGKTYTLANRVARLLLADARPAENSLPHLHQGGRRRNAGAAVPAAGRMVDAARRGSARPRSSRSAATPMPTCAKARRLFAGALETPGGLKVLTIHAFCQIVLSRFPLEAGIPPAFEVLDDQTAREMIAEARQRVLERAGSGDAVLASRGGHAGDRNQRGHAQRPFWTPRWAVTAASWTAFSRACSRPGHGRARAAWLAEGEDAARRSAADFCAAPDARRSNSCAPPQSWLAAGGKNDAEAGGAAGRRHRRCRRTASRRWARLLLTGEGEPRVKLASKKLADARPDLLTYLIDAARALSAPPPSAAAPPAPRRWREAALTRDRRHAPRLSEPPSGCAACWIMTT